MNYSNVTHHDDGLYNFQFAIPQSIHFGVGKRDLLGSLIAREGRRIMVISSPFLSRTGWKDWLEQHVWNHSTTSSYFMDIRGEPTLSLVDAAVNAAQEFQPDVIVAIGGGSVIDVGKAVRGLVHSPYPLIDYLEGVGIGRKLESPVLPFIVLPTTAGTGSEVTKNAVIGDPDRKFKKSFRSTRLIPTHVLIDPTMQKTTPPHITAIAGMDALTQLIEAYISNKATAITRPLCQAGVQSVRSGLLRAYQQPTDLEARSEMAFAALMSGMVLANSGLGLAHGIAAGMGSQIPIPHGLACAVLLPLVFKINHTIAATELAEISRILVPTCEGSSKEEQILAGYQYILSLLDEMHLWEYFKNVPLTSDQIQAITQHSFGNSMKGNPVTISPEQVETWLYQLIKREIYTNGL
jgi:alcohol dehydrogenase class IV